MFNGLPPRIFGAIATAAVLAVSFSQSSAIAVPRDGTKNVESLPPAAREFEQFQIDHPNDLAAQDQKAMELFNSHLEVEFQGHDSFVTGTEAQAEINAQNSFARPHSVMTQRDVAEASSLPNDVFDVYIVKVNTLFGWEFGGHWKFAGYFAGQTDPDDVAALEFNIDNCAQLSNLDVVTYDTAGRATNLGSLKDANVVNHSPIYNVHDQESGFSNQADSGAALAWLTADNCPLNHYDGQAAFTYDAIEGGSVNSVSASYGALSISTSGSTLELQKSTNPFSFVY